MTTFTPGKEPRLRGNLGAGAPRTVIIADDGKYTAEGTAEFGFVGRVHAIEAEINVITCDNSASLVFCVEAYNPGTGLWDTLANTGTVGTAVGCMLLVGPNVPQVADNSVAHVLRDRMRVHVKPADTKCIEYSIIVSAQ